MLCIVFFFVILSKKKKRKGEDLYYIEGLKVFLLCYWVIIVGCFVYNWIILFKFMMKIVE